jgi:uncharacterized protein YaaN involved in tellurite resistance
MKMQNYLTKRDMESLSLDKLDESRKSEILSIKDSINFDYTGTLDYASNASKNLTDFSTSLLETIKVKDTPDIQETVTTLLTGLSKVDANTLLEYKPSLFKRLFKQDELKMFIAQYEDVASVIKGVKTKLEQANFQLKKDIEQCNMFLDENMKYINDLDNYIMAGKLKLAEERKLLEEERKEVDETDMLDVHNFNAHQTDVDRFDRKLYDLMLMREIAVQNIPQIMLIKDGDGVLIEKIQSSINSAIPLWESQMVIAIQLLRQRGALAIQKNVTDATNSLIEKNSELLKNGSLEVAKELERGIIDVDVLKKNSENLISTLEGIRSIQQQGREERAKATQELAQIQVRLNEQLLLQGSK